MLDAKKQGRSKVACQSSQVDFLEEMLRNIVADAIDTFGAEHCVIAFPNEGGQKWAVRAEADASGRDGLSSKSATNFYLSLARRCFKDRVSLLCMDLQDADHEEAVRGKSVISALVRTLKGPLGVIQLSREAGVPFTTEDLYLADAFAAYASSGIEAGRELVAQRKLLFQQKASLPSSIAETSGKMYELKIAVPEATRQEPVETPKSETANKEPEAEFDRLVGILMTKHESYKSDLQRQFEGLLNAFLESQNPDTFDQKKAVVERINKNLDYFGLEIAYEGRACNLLAVAGPRHQKGRFLLRAKGSSSPLVQRSHLADLLPLHLIDAVPRREAFVEWRERVRSGQEIGDSPTQRK